MTNNQINGPNNTRITVDEDMLRYGGYYTRKAYRRLLQTAQPAPGVIKHIKAHSNDQAKSMSSGGGHAQYLTSVDHAALERRAILEGRMYVDPEKNAVYFYYDAGTIIGYDRGKPVSTMRAELTPGENGALFHGHPMDKDRMKSGDIHSS